MSARTCTIEQARQPVDDGAILQVIAWKQADAEPAGQDVTQLLAFDLIGDIAALHSYDDGAWPDVSLSEIDVVLDDQGQTSVPLRQTGAYAGFARGVEQGLIADDVASALRETSTIAGNINKAKAQNIPVKNASVMLYPGHFTTPRQPQPKPAGLWDRITRLWSAKT